MQSKLIGSFCPVDKYQENIESIREYYKDYIVDDKIKVLSIDEPNTLKVKEYLVLWNIHYENRIIFRRGDIAFNRSGTTVFTINALNSILRSQGLEKGDKVDFSEYRNYIITELADAPLFRRSRFLCFG
jgi:signal peptidase I